MNAHFLHLVILMLILAWVQGIIPLFKLSNNFWIRNSHGKKMFGKLTKYTNQKNSSESDDCIDSTTKNNFILIANSNNNDDTSIYELVEVIVALISKNPTIAFVTIVNVIIFIAWQQVPESIMRKYALDNDSNLEEGRWWTWITASFSHQSTSHLVSNLAAFQVFGPASLQYLGTIPFLSSLIVASIISSAFSTLFRRKMVLSFAQLSKRELFTARKNSGSLGFSGVCTALFVIYAKAVPRAIMNIGETTQPVQTALFEAIGLDIIGAIVNLFHNTGIDHSAHIGGYVSGYLTLGIFSVFRKVSQSIQHFLRRYRLQRFQIGFSHVIVFLTAYIFFDNFEDEINYYKKQIQKNIKKSFQQLF